MSYDTLTHPSVMTVWSSGDSQTWLLPLPSCLLSTLVQLECLLRDSSFTFLADTGSELGCLWKILKYTDFKRGKPQKLYAAWFAEHQALRRLRSKYRLSNLVKIDSRDCVLPSLTKCYSFNIDWDLQFRVQLIDIDIVVQWFRLSGLHHEWIFTDGKNISLLIDYFLWGLVLIDYFLWGLVLKDYFLCGLLLIDHKERWKEITSLIRGCHIFNKQAENFNIIIA